MQRPTNLSSRARARLQRFLGITAAEQVTGELDGRVRRLEGSDLEWRALVDAHHQTRMLADHANQLGERAALLGDQYGLTLHDHDTRVARLERLAAVRTMTWWIEQAVVDDSTTVSVVLATRNRAAAVLDAVSSVVDQHYANWQLVVVDDGSTDDTQARLTTLDDERIQVVGIDHVGAYGARNAGLDRVTGGVVTYLDDDNLMHPLWLKAVAWAFSQRPDVGVLYGARLADDGGRLRGDGDGELPVLHFEPFDRDALAEGNLADLGVLAHRTGLAEGRFDARLRRYGDWDLLRRLTADGDPLELPAVACLYRTDRPDRISVTVDGERDLDLIREKLDGG